MVYKFAPGSGFSGDAEATFLELENIRKQNDGKLQTHDVVDAARSKNSPLHPHFEWDDHKAAEKYRQNTARSLVRAIIVQPDQEKGKKEQTTFKPYISVTTEENGEKQRYYQNIEVASKDEFESALEMFQLKLAQLQTAIEQMEMYAKNEDQRKIASRLKRCTMHMENVAYT